MAACCLLRRQVTEGRQRRGIASGATEHLRTGNQPQSRKVVRSLDPPVAPTANGPSHSVGRPELVRPMVTGPSGCFKDSAETTGSLDRAPLPGCDGSAGE